MATLNPATPPTGTATTPAISTSPTTPPNPSTAAVPTAYKITSNTQPIYGEQNPAVKALQIKLNGMGANLSEDSKYGPLTQAAYDKYLGTTNTSGSTSNTSPGANSGSTEPSTTPPEKSEEQKNMDTAKTEAEDISKNNLAEAQKVHDQILGIQNGSIPLSAGEQAQIDGLKQQFQQLIDQQVLTNTGASGLANVRGFQTGAAEYDSNFQVKTIGSIVTAGANKIADLNIKMASAVAALTQSFKDNDIAAVKSAYDILSNAQKDRQTAIQKTIDDTQKIIKDAQDRQQKITDSINDVTKDVAKNGAPTEVKKAVSEAVTVSDAINAAGDWLQTATGSLGDYLQYKRDTDKKGLVPLDYQTWTDQQNVKASKLKASEAYSSAYGAAAGKAAAEAKYGNLSGNDTVSNLAQQLVAGNIAPSELSKRATGSTSYNAVLKAADDYSMLTTGKHFSIAQADRDYKFAQRPQTQDTLNYLKSLTGTVDSDGNLSGGNLDELRALSDSMNRTSFPALNNVQKWASLGTGDPKYAQFQAVSTEVADQVAKILQGGGGGGTSDAKLQQAANLFNTGFTKQQLNGVIDSLKPLLQNRAKSMVGDNPYLKDYSDELGVNTGAPSAKTQVNTYISSNPKEKDTVMKLYSMPGWGDQDVWDYITKNKK